MGGTVQTRGEPARHFKNASGRAIRRIERQRLDASDAQAAHAAGVGILLWASALKRLISATIVG
ncbi:hypothetical protein KCP74_20810 [Salmonella enterica subsp. enterica]|nr:hypothetical protein KCP74_20810 [Salmonella enterica subsp. enterica]